MDFVFEHLTPERFLPALEEALSCELKGYAAAFHSYINRVYELQTTGGEPLVVKFYRPGRWSADALLDEHDYLWECEDSGIPVVPPYELADGSTLGKFDGIYFAVFPKKRGRDVAFDTAAELEQAGRLIGRLHAVGARRKAEFRLTLEPELMIGSVIERLADSAFPGRRQFEEFVDLCNEVADIACPEFPDSSAFLRLHGDLHRANILNRPDDGLILIDFDDMLNGPAIQDLWLLLPDIPSHCPEEAEAIARGYSLFMDFSGSDFALAECLRTLRMLYFLSWVAMQRNDPHFSASFPDWGSDAYWRGEFTDLRRQIPRMKEEIRFWRKR